MVVNDLCFPLGVNCMDINVDKRHRLTKGQTQGYLTNMACVGSGQTLLLTVVLLNLAILALKGVPYLVAYLQKTLPPPPWSHTHTFAISIAKDPILARDLTIYLARGFHGASLGMRNHHGATSRLHLCSPPHHVKNFCNASRIDRCRSRSISL